MDLDIPHARSVRTSSTSSTSTLSDSTIYSCQPGATLPLPVDHRTLHPPPSREHIAWTLACGRVLSIHRDGFTEYLDALRASQPTVPVYRLVEEESGTCSAYTPTALSQMRGLLESYRPAERTQVGRLYRGYLEEMGVYEGPEEQGKKLRKKRSFVYGLLGSKGGLRGR